MFFHVTCSRVWLIPCVRFAERHISDLRHPQLLVLPFLNPLPIASNSLPQMHLQIQRALRFASNREKRSTVTNPHFCPDISTRAFTYNPFRNQSSQCFHRVGPFQLTDNGRRDSRLSLLYLPIQYITRSAHMPGACTGLFEQKAPS